MNILQFAQERTLELINNAMRSVGGNYRIDHSADETPIGAGYYAIRKHKSETKWNWKLVKADNSSTLVKHKPIKPIRGPQSEKRRKLYLKRREAGLTSNGRKVA